jgi:hypothetical protein
VSTFLTSSHCTLRSNTEGADKQFVRKVEPVLIATVNGVDRLTNVPTVDMDANKTLALVGVATCIGTCVR